MKKLVIIKEFDEYVSNLISESKCKPFYCNDLPLSGLIMLGSSQSLEDTEKLLIFDTSLMKLKKDVIEVIENTKHNVLVITDDEKKVPTSIKVICEKEIIETPNTPKILDTIGKLGTPRLNLEGIKSLPLGQLIKYLNVNWQKFESDTPYNKDIYDLLINVNKRLYKVGEDYLYLYLLYGFPEQKRRTFFKYPARKKSVVKDSILVKVANYYGYSTKEVGRMWWLIRKIMNSRMADKYKLTNMERKLLGLKKKEPLDFNKDIEKEHKRLDIDKKLKSKNLLEL